jgi:hypothetical protein
METRELYKAKYQAQIHEWAAKLDVLKARGEKMSAQTRLDAKPRMDAMHASLEAARAKMHEIGTATDESWKRVKKDLDHAWNETRGAVQGAHDAVMSMGGTPDAAPAATAPLPVAAKSS